MTETFITSVNRILKLLLFVAAFAAGAKFLANRPVVATSDAMRTVLQISSYLYGQFIEPAGNLIYKGLWCDILDERKFYYPFLLRLADDTNTVSQGSNFGGNCRRESVTGNLNLIMLFKSVAVLAPTDLKQAMKLNISGASLPSKVTLRRTASGESIERTQILTVHRWTQSSVTYTAAIEWEHL